MGHYRSEMVCNICGNHPCTCPTKPDPVGNMWLVDTDDSVVTVAEHDLKYKYTNTKFGALPAHPEFRRMDWCLYKTKDKALASIPSRIEADISLAEKQVKSLQTELVTLRTKLKKVTRWLICFDRQNQTC